MKKYRAEKNCLNCGNVVEVNFCPNCGQENIETREPFWSFLIHSLGHYFHFDSTFFNSLGPLITKPGYLTLEYIKGKRASHFPPVTLYLFISLIFFLSVSIQKPKINQDIKLDKLPGVEKELDSLQKWKDAHPNLSSIEKTKLEQRIDALRVLKTNAAVFQTDSSSFRLRSNSDTTSFKTVAAYSQAQAQLAPHKRDGAVLALINTRSIELEQRYGNKLLEKLVEAVIHQLPKMMFILMPLFALILSISFYRSHLYFLEHLIYTLHVHSFLFLQYTLIELIGLVWPSAENIAMTLGIIAAVWYIYRSMRNVYNRSRLHTLAKFGILSIAYFILMAISFTLIVLFSLATL